MAWRLPLLYLFIDEAGNLWQSAGGEQNCFVVVAVATRQPRVLAKLFIQVKRARLGKKLKKLPEIKASNAPDLFRRSLYQRLAKEDLDVYIAAVNVADIPAPLKQSEGYLYTQLIGELLTRCPLDDERAVYLFFDNRKLKGLTREQFDYQLSTRLALRFGMQTQFVIQHVDSTTNLGVQVADYVCWAIYRRYQRGDATWYGLIRSKVKLTLRPFKK